ncbi:MAG: hypothetical protein ABI356_12065, partial [Steroidobacteraceae bacterium]
QAAADGEPGTVAKTGGLPGDEPHPRQRVSARQLTQRAARARVDAPLAESWAAGTGGPMRA